MVEIIDSALRAVIDSLKIDTMNSLNKKKIKTNFIMSKALFGVIHKKKQKKLLLLFKAISGHVNPVFEKASNVKHLEHSRKSKNKRKKFN